MTTLFEIKQFIDLVANKHGLGNTYDPIQYTYLLQYANDYLFGKKIKSAIALINSGGSVADKITELGSMKNFIEYSGAIASIGNRFVLPDDYRHWISVSDVTTLKNIDVVDESEYSLRRSNIYYNADQLPFCKITDEYIYPVPNDIAAAELVYFREPVEPNYDWCIVTATMEEVYMPVGSYIAGTDLLIDVPGIGTLLKSGVSHLYGHTDSETEELEWDKDGILEIVDIILEKIGVRDRDQLLAQYQLQQNAK